jgi:hypothetical protein
MPSARAILAELLIVLTIYSATRAGSPPKHDSEGDQIDAGFTLDLAVSPDSLERLAVDLKKLGVQAIGSSSATTSSRQIHILVGPFNSADAAARYGNFLVARGVIVGFTVREPGRPGATSRAAGPDRALKFSYDAALSDSSRTSSWRDAGSLAPTNEGAGASGPSGPKLPPASNVAASDVAMTGTPATPPVAAAAMSGGPDPVNVALHDIAGVKVERTGGLWLAGDVDEGFSRLQWIAGPGNANVLQLAADGKVSLRSAVLMHVSGADRAGAVASLVLTDYIKSNEGLYLLAQLVAAENRYCLYLGARVPTAGNDIEIDGAINLDNNFDSRINTYRRDGMKLPNECPPEGFDSLVAINPAAHWFNLRVKHMVSDGVIVFHELAEALAKVDSGLEYLPDGLRAGAHDIAVQREQRLQSERPGSGTVITLGSNVVFKNRESFMKFKAEHQTAPGRW